MVPLLHLPLISAALTAAVWLLPQHGTVLVEVIGDLLVANPISESQSSF